jgi:hypothetical protein
MHFATARQSVVHTAAAPHPATLAAAIDQRLPAGPAVEKRMLNTLAHFLAAQPNLAIFSAKAVDHLRATVSATHNYKLLKPLVAGRPDIFGIVGDSYRLRASTLLQAAGRPAAPASRASPPPPAAVASPRPEAAAAPPSPALAAAIDRLLPAGPAEEQRVLHGLAHHLSLCPALTCSSSTAVIHLRAKVSPAFEYSGGRLRGLVAGRPDVFEILREGDTVYRLRSAALLQAAAAAPLTSAVAASLNSLPACVLPFFLAVAKAMQASPVVLSPFIKKTLMATAAAHWQHKLHGADYARAAMAMFGPKNLMPPLALPSCELVFACGCAKLGALMLQQRCC